MRDNGIVSQWTPPYTPQYNSVSERRNRTFLDMVRSMMSLAELPKSFLGKGERASGLLGLIHSDVCGPITTDARGDFLYFITFIDDYSRFGYVFLIKHNSETFEKFKKFRQLLLCSLFV